MNLANERNSGLDNMRSLPQTRHTAFSLMRCTALATVLGAMLIGCSTPDGPPQPADNPATKPPATEASEPTQMPSQASAPGITLNGPGQLLPVSATAEMKGETFELEIAQTREQQSLGLMFRSALPDNRGMLFPFSSPRRTSFWMKDVPVALDMVFLRNGKVVAIAPSAAPCPTEPCPTYGPANQIVDQVIELRSGRAAEIDLQPGDTVTITALP
jgi:uncharacterized protein